MGRLKLKAKRFLEQERPVCHHVDKLNLLEEFVCTSALKTLTWGRAGWRRVRFGSYLRIVCLSLAPGPALLLVTLS